MSDEFLDVKKSLSERAWFGPSKEQERIASGIVQEYDISSLSAVMLVKRGIKPNELTSFLSPKIRDLMPDPYILKDMEKASKRILEAVKKKQGICIFADYDVDGTTSASMLLLWLKHFEIIPEIYIPDRVKEGYGPNPVAMEILSKKNKLIICVDCGTNSHESIEIANKNGADVLVLDHHIASEKLPPALAIINPKRHDESSKLDYLCAAGVVFLFLVALNRLLKKNKTAVPDLINFLDLVSLATVADVVPLVGLNRALVLQGLRILANRARPGLVALIDQAKIKSRLTSYHLGYLLAPRINAAGRLSDAKFAVNLLTATSDLESSKIARELNELNIKRRSLEADALNEAIAQVEIQGREEDKVIWVFSDRWHPGVLGIVAARLKDKFSVPSIVFSLNKEGIAIGSARSVPSINIGCEIKKLVDSGLLLSGGGHHMAAGIKSKESLLAEAMRILSVNIQNTQLSKKVKPAVEIDSLLTVKGVTIEIVEEINSIGPFGAGNPPPIIAIANCQINHTKILNEKHIKFTCQDTTGKRLESIFFNGAETKAGQRLLSNAGENFHLCGTLEINDWGGYRRVVFQVRDVATI